MQAALSVLVAFALLLGFLVGGLLAVSVLLLLLTGLADAAGRLLGSGRDSAHTRSS